MVIHLGADDKCGVAEIMEVASTSSQRRKTRRHLHLFPTPDEEIGNGANRFENHFELF